MATVDDRAGKEYWDDVWSSNNVPNPINPKNNSFSNFTSVRIHQFINEFMGQYDLKGKSVLEVGCGSSSWLPYFALEYGCQVTGLDYSPQGCEKSRKILENSQVSGEVFQGDLFSPPPQLLQKFDLVYSMGVVEHFQPTEEVFNALSKLVKPGGYLFTEIPNMSGCLGSLQKWGNKAVYDIHVPLDKASLEEAHSPQFYKIIKSKYLVFHNPGLIVFSYKKNKLLFTLLRKALALSSLFIYLFEKYLFQLPTNKWTSPYIVTLAVKK